MTFLMMLATSFLIGLQAQKTKGRTGATWGFITLFLLLPTWFLIYICTSMVDPTIWATDVGWCSSALLVCIFVGGLMSAVVATLPKKSPGSSPSHDSSDKV